MNSITYLVMTTNKYINRQQNVLKTWGKNVDLYFYSDQSTDEKTIKVTNKSDYWSLEEKHINMIKYLKNNFLDKEWFFLCDDDTFVNTKNLNEFVKTCDSDIVYGCLINAWEKDYDFFYPSGGAGILIHRNNINILSEKIKHLNTRFADVTLGINLVSLGIKIKHEPRFYYTSPKKYNITESELKNCLTFHHISEYLDMFILNEKCK